MYKEFHAFLTGQLASAGRPGSFQSLAVLVRHRDMVIPELPAMGRRDWIQCSVCELRSLFSCTADFAATSIWSRSCSWLFPPKATMKAFLPLRIWLKITSSSFYSSLSWACRNIEKAVYTEAGWHHSLFSATYVHSIRALQSRIGFCTSEILTVGCPKILLLMPLDSMTCLNLLWTPWEGK